MAGFYGELGKKKSFQSAGLPPPQEKGNKKERKIDDDFTLLSPTLCLSGLQDKKEVAADVAFYTMDDSNEDLFWNLIRQSHSNKHIPSNPPFPFLPQDKKGREMLFTPEWQESRQSL